MSLHIIKFDPVHREELYIPECFLVIITYEMFQNRVNWINSLNYSRTYLFLRCSEAVI